jgi:hypothetical protein
MQPMSEYALLPRARTLASTEWLTPPSIIEKLGPFDLDPCSPVTRPWNTAAHHIDEQTDGLISHWFGYVWMNPPFGKGLAKWVEKLSKHDNGIALIPLRSTETKWFHNYVWSTASAVLFCKGRIRYWSLDGIEKGSCPHASLFISYGIAAKKKLEESGIAGKLIVLRDSTI